MTKKKKNTGKEKLKRIEKDLKKAKGEESIVVDEDMGESKSMPPTSGLGTAIERPLPEYKGVKLFYRKFVSKLRKALGKE